jgi:mRNA interferase RelE/StbE
VNSYALDFASRVEKSLAALPEEMQYRILEELQVLTESPFAHQGVKKLKDRPGYRVRVGDYRIIYEIDTKSRVITVLTIAHRSRAY